MKYLIIYDQEQVLIIIPYSPITICALGSAYSLVATLQDAKIMLSAANIDYSQFDEISLDDIE